MPKLSDLKTIRIIIQDAPGTGHQAAAFTAMKKLRALGFNGVFDIRYSEQTFFTLCTLYLAPDPTNTTGIKIASLIHGYTPPELSRTTQDAGQTLQDPAIGEVTITRLAYISERENHTLPPVELTLCAGDDDTHAHKNVLEKYCTQQYIGIQLTEWKGLRFTARRGIFGTSITNINEDARLTEDEKCNNLTTLTNIENRIFDICSNEMVNTQLLYGIYNSSKCIDIHIEFERLIKAHRVLMQNENKHLVLFLPRDLQVFNILKKNHQDIVFINLHDPKIATTYQKPTIICAFTDIISPGVFHKLMGSMTTYPPIIEGCNSIEYCESLGLPFIVGGRLTDDNTLKKYDFSQDKHEPEFTQHLQASSCLTSINGEREIASLSAYMKDSKESKNLDYHLARKKHHLARPDAVTQALSLLNYTYRSNQRIAKAPSAKAVLRFDH